MKPALKLLAFALLAGALVYVSCKKEKSCEGCAEKNKPPVANAGPDQTITLPTDSVSLNGINSSDPDGMISVWLWTKISGPASFNIVKSSDSTTKIRALVIGIYQFELKVTDNGGLNTKDTMRVIVSDHGQPNRPPIANAGADQIITLPNNAITLNGSGSTDPDNNITSYAWTKISGPSSFTISNATSMQTPVTNLVQGTYQVELKVTDAGGLFSKDTMQVIVNPVVITNHPPVANAGIDQTIILPTNTINLDGSGSTDPDNNITSYAWTRISGPSSFSIVNPNAIQTPVINLIKGAYQFELKVTDAGGLFSKDTLNVCVFESLSGQEIIYNSSWGCNDLCQDGDVYWNSESNQCNPYIDSNMLLQVSVRLDTSVVWIDVHKFNSPLPPINQFYWVIDRGLLWIFAYQGSLIGTPVTIKVNFL